MFLGNQDWSRTFVSCQHSAVLVPSIAKAAHITERIKVLLLLHLSPTIPKQNLFSHPSTTVQYLVCNHIMSINQAGAQPMAFASLQSDVPDIAPPSSANNGGNDMNDTTAKVNPHPSPPSHLPVVTPIDDTKDTIPDQSTTIQPPTLGPPHQNNVAPSLSSSLTKQALPPPPASIFPPPSTAAAASATSSVYHHPHADGRKKLGVAIKATANMYGSMSPSAGTFAMYHFIGTFLFRISLISLHSSLICF